MRVVIAEVAENVTKYLIEQTCAKKEVTTKLDTRLTALEALVAGLTITKSVGAPNPQLFPSTDRCALYPARIRPFSSHKLNRTQGLDSCISWPTVSSRVS